MLTAALGPALISRAPDGGRLTTGCVLRGQWGQLPSEATPPLNPPSGVRDPQREEAGGRLQTGGLPPACGLNLKPPATRQPLKGC
jgi:hypothetical protein